MPRFFVPKLQALCIALVMGVLSPALAETKSPLLGKTREQVVTQLGEPKSNIRVGAREMLFFAKVKLTLRNDVVIETEALPEEAPAAPVPPPAAKRPAETAAATPEQSASQTPAQPAGPATSQTTASPAADTTTAASSAKAAEGAPKPAKPPEPTLSIKFIKSGSGSAKAAPQTAAVPTAAPPPVPIAATPTATAVAPAPANESKKTASVAPAAAESKPLANVTPAKVEPPKVEEPAEVAAEPDAPAAEETTAKPKIDPKKKATLLAKVRNRWRARRDAETEETSVEIFSGRSYVLAAIVIVGGMAFMWWRHSQRELALEASAVSHSPFSPPASVDPSAMFSNEQIGGLGQRKFERLVASYYMKTGVVAERTNAEPGAPVHIKIFWKGEQKPFAGVQCHANPPALIPGKPLENLFEALTAADIRRGYVVTTGKFSVEARDYAAEKVFTLLTGDLFVEKLNALPPAARAELLTEANTEEPAAPA